MRERGFERVDRKRGGSEMKGISAWKLLQIVFPFPSLLKLFGAKKMLNVENK